MHIDKLTIQKFDKPQIIILIGIFIAFLALSALAFAEEGAESPVDKAVVRITKELKLTDPQIKAVRAIFTDYFNRRQEILDKEEMPISKARRDELLLALKQEEDQKMAQVLTPEQMDQLHAKDQMRQMLNKDKLDFQEYQWDPNSSSQFRF